MIIKSQIEKLSSLYNELNYDEVIRYGKITLSLSLEEKRYQDALRCYEYIVSAHIEKWNYSDFYYLVGEYENLCLTYGEDNNKMIFYYLLSLLKTITKDYDEAIAAAKRSIKYAHYFHYDELIIINYSNIALQSLLNGKVENARIAMKLAQYYKAKIPSLNKTIVRGYTSLLYYYAEMGDFQQFQSIKNEFLQNLNESHCTYKAAISLNEGILMFNLQNEAACLYHFEKAYRCFVEQQSLMHLKTIEKVILKFNLQGKFRYIGQLQVTTQDAYNIPLEIKEIQSIHKDVFFADELPAVTFKYPNVISRDVITRHVEEALKLNESLYCIHWCYITNQLETLFGNLFVEQLLFELFETTYQILFEYDAKVIVRSKNEGEAIIKNIYEKDFFKLLTNLEEKLKLNVFDLTKGCVDIPIHFGFVHSNQLPHDQYNYKGLVAHADASLYYAKSQEQLYIFS